jgi:pimeloyl-ACP methyl ester carboxylesterase
MTNRLVQFLSFSILIFIFTCCNTISWYHQRLDKQFVKFFEHTTYFELNGAKVFCQYSISDTTKPYLLLLHGFGVDGRLTMFQHYKPFSKKYNLIIPDLPSFGKSINYSNNYSVYNTAHTIRLLIDTLHLPKQKLYICGLSYGGLIAALVNKELAGNLGGINLNCTPIKYFDVRFFTDTSYNYNVNSGIDLVLPTNSKTLKALFKAGSVNRFYIPKIIRKQILKDIFLPNRAEKVKVIQSIVSEANLLATDDYGFQFQKHISLVAGDKDNLIPPSIADSMKLSIAKHAEYKIFKHQSHNLISESKRKWRKWINEVLDKWEAERLAKK